MVKLIIPSSTSNPDSSWDRLDRTTVPLVTGVFGTNASVASTSPHLALSSDDKQSTASPPAVQQSYYYYNFLKPRPTYLRLPHPPTPSSLTAIMSSTTDDQRPRDLMYCHQCENEWYRDEHGLTCPECASDFTEVIEPNHDPRDEEPPELQQQQYADPDEADIQALQWQPGQPEQRLHFHRPVTLAGAPIAPVRSPQGAGGGLMGMVGSLFQTAVGGLQQQYQQQQEQQQEQAGRNLRGNPSSIPSPSRPVFGNTTIRQYTGNGYSMTFTSSSTTASNLFPRSADQPQAFQNQPIDIHQAMEQMMMNIGALRGVPAVQGGAQGGHHHPGHGTPEWMFQMLGLRGGVMGDAVLSDEALDQVMTQLMEQHQTGNAPGPATHDAIAALPTKQIGKEDLDDSGKADCSICMDEVKLNDTVTVLPCKHWFHFDCVKAWLVEHDTCPHCRQGIMPRDGGAEAGPRSPGQAPQNNMHSSAATRPASSTGGGMFARMRSTFGGNSNGNNAGSSGIS